MVQLKNKKKTDLFFTFSVLWGKAFCLQGDFLGLGVCTVLVLTVKNKLGEWLLFVACPENDSNKQNDCYGCPSLI